MAEPLALQPMLRQRTGFGARKTLFSLFNNPSQRLQPLANRKGKQCFPAKLRCPEQALSTAGRSLLSGLMSPLLTFG